MRDLRIRSTAPSVISLRSSPAAIWLEVWWLSGRLERSTLRRPTYEPSTLGRSILERWVETSSTAPRRPRPSVAPVLPRSTVLQVPAIGPTIAQDRAHPPAGRYA